MIDYMVGRTGIEPMNMTTSRAHTKDGVKAKIGLNLAIKDGPPGCSNTQNDPNQVNLSGG